MRKSASSDVSNSIISITILVLKIATVLFTINKSTQCITHYVQRIECVPSHSIGAEFGSNSIAMTVRRIVCVLYVATHRRIVSAIVVTHAHLSVGRAL